MLIYLLIGTSLPMGASVAAGIVMPEAVAGVVVCGCGVAWLLRRNPHKFVQLGCASIPQPGDRGCRIMKAA